MASDSSSIQRWLNRTTRSGVRRYHHLVLTVDELAGKTPVATWVASEVAQGLQADPAEFASSIWEQIQDHTSEAQRHRRFELSWLDKEGADLGSQVVRCSYTGEDPLSDTSPEGQIAMAHAHSIAQAQAYANAQQRADEIMDRAVAVLERVVERQEAQLAAMHAREMDVAKREQDAAALGPKQSSDAEVLEAQTRGEVVQLVKHFVEDAGGGKAVASAIERWVPGAEKQNGNAITKDKPS